MSNEKIKTFKKYFDRFNQEKHLKRKKAIHFNEDDKVEIPLIEFNLAKTFDEISGSNFTSDQRSFIITELFQRNAFVLNENGAEVESEVEFVVVESAEEIGEPKPKMMIFDKPFVVFLKRKDAENPYFGIYIANNELLKQIK
jgi:serine protease inhibitor